MLMLTSSNDYVERELCGTLLQAWARGLKDRTRGIDVSRLQRPHHVCSPNVMPSHAESSSLHSNKDLCSILDALHNWQDSQSALPPGMHAQEQAWQSKVQFLNSNLEAALLSGHSI